VSSSVNTGESESVTRERTLVERILGRREFGVVLAVVGLLIVGIVVRADVFLTIGNFVGVLRNAAVVSIIGYAMTMLITAGEFDLSVGSVMGVAGGLTAIMLLDGHSMVFILVVVTVLAILYGAFQGILVTKLGLPSLIVTIGTLTLLRGGHLVLLGNVTQTVPSDVAPALLTVLGGTLRLPFDVLMPLTDVRLLTIPAINYALPVIHDSQQSFNSIPLQIVWVVVFGALFHYVLFYTRFGYRSQLTGGNQQASRYTGIRTEQIKIANFAIVAVFAAFAGIGQLAFTGNVSPLTGDGIELIVIAAVVIGGTDLFGGEGTISGTFLGALVFAFTQNILVLAGFGTQLFAIFTGLFIIFAVGVDAVTRRARSEALEEWFFEPVRAVVRRPRTFFEEVENRIQGVDGPLVFFTFVTVAWILPTFVVVLLTFVTVGSTPIIPLEFSLFIVGSDVAVFGTLPLLAAVISGTIMFLSLVFVHTTVRAFGGTGNLEQSVQIVSYSLAPTALLFVPIVLFGFDFILPLVLVTLVPIVGGVGVILYFGVAELHDLDRSSSIGVVAVTGLLWAVALAYLFAQL
jgi:simple sugar transport system permease protein